MDKIRTLLTSEVSNAYPVQESLHEGLSRQQNLAPDQLLLTPGIDGAIRSFFQAYVRPGDKVACLRPSYAMYEVYAQMFGAEVVPVEFDQRMGVDVTDLKRASAESKYFFLANPNQPTGTYLSVEIIQNLLEISTANSALLILDEAYAPFAGVSWVGQVSQQTNLLVLQTFSKAYGLAGFRVGWAAGPTEVISNMRKVRSTYDINSAALLFAEQLLLEPKILAEHLADLQAGKELLITRAANLGFEPLKTYTNFLLLKVPEPLHASDLQGRLKERGYLIKTFQGVPCMEDLLRVTLASPKVLSLFCDALTDAIKED
ncbi:histidinol-phosphate aminotransferase family protein [Verrucomicrobia bacterium]|nr:histidinol-phosphate aminotransferase family protein [Verrucomicrobiota bacterium]